MMLLGMIFDKGDNKVIIPFYLYRWTTAKNTASFYIRTPYDMTHGTDIPVDLFYGIMRRSYREWFETF